jgi:hypothetical protein
MNFAFDVFERNIDLELEDQQTWNLTFVFRRQKESVSRTGGVRSFPPERKKPLKRAGHLEFSVFSLSLMMLM